MVHRVESPISLLLDPFNTPPPSSKFPAPHALPRCHPLSLFPNSLIVVDENLSITHICFVICAIAFPAYHKSMVQYTHRLHALKM